MNALEKIAVRLTKEEKRRQAAQFTALGAASGPIIGAAGNLIQHGKMRPPTNVPLKKWVPATMATGALISGAVPAIRHKLEREMQQGARERLRAAKAKTAGETRVSFGLKHKLAAMNLTGRDNRTPFVGKTQFPTEGSKQFSKKLFSAGRNKAEVGPAPLLGKMDKSRTSTFYDHSVKMPSPMGSLPKIGADMSLANDPLIRYLQTEMGQEELQKTAARLEYNLENAPQGKQRRELTSRPSGPSGDSISRSNEQTDAHLKELFDNYPAEKAVIS